MDAAMGLRWPDGIAIPLPGVDGPRSPSRRAGTCVEAPKQSSQISEAKSVGYEKGLDAVVWPDAGLTRRGRSSRGCVVTGGELDHGPREPGQPMQRPMTVGSDLAQEDPMVPAKAFISPSRSSANTDRASSRQFVEFDHDRSRDCRRRHRVLSSALRVAALFHPGIDDRRIVRH